MMLLEQLNSRQLILDRNISDVMGHVNNSQFAASSLSNSSIVVYNLTVNCSEVSSQYHGSYSRCCMTGVEKSE